MKKLLLLFAAAGTVGLFAQSSVQPVPDCTGNFSFLQSGGATQVSGIYTNYPASGGTGGGVCDTWTVSYITSGLSTSISVLFQSANVGSGQLTPASFTNYVGTTSVGSNPTTTLTGGTAQFSNGATSTGFVRVQVSGLVDTGGRVWGTIFGWRTGPSGSGGGGGGGGCPGTTGTPCVVDGVTAAGSAPTTPPVLTAGQDGTNVQTIKTDTSGNVDVSQIAHSRASVTVSSSGLTQILAASGSTVITVYHFSILMASTVGVQLEYGTGSACGTGTTAITGVYQNAAGIALDIPFALPAGNALCVNLSSGVAGGGLLLYSQL